MNSKRRTLHLFSGLACVGIAATTLGCAGSVTVVTENSGDAVAETAPTAVVWPDEAFRATQPEPGPAPTLKVPTAQSFTLDNGLTVVLVPHTLPVFSMSLEFPMGTAHESAKKAGTMGLCMDLLDEGTKSKDKVAFEIAQADAGLSLGSYAAREESGVFVRGLAEQLDSGVALVAEMMTAPGLRAEDLDRLKSDRKASLMQARASGRGAASRVMQTRMWGAGHPMATLSTEQSIDKVKLSDCKNVVKKLKPGGATLFITGQVDEAQVRAAFAAHLPNWKGKSESKRMDKPAKPVTGTIFVIDIPGAAQSSINVGFAGPLRTADDYEATNVASMVYGGGFTSRLNMNIREDKGYAYGARGGFSYTKHTGSFRAGSSVATPHTAAALREVENELKGMVSNPVTSDELERERAALMLSMPARYATASSILRRFQSLAFYGLPFDDDAKALERIKALELAAVRDSAKAYMQPGAATVVVAGDVATMGAELEALAKEGIFGATSVTYVDADGKKVAKPKYDKKTAKPEGKGKPASAGKPEGKGKPASAGKPEGKGKPASAGKPEGKGKGKGKGKGN